MPITDKVKYILYDLTRFNKTLDSVRTTEDRWLYLLKHAGGANDLPDFGDDVISQAIKRILVENASDKLIKEQARDMVFTEEELDYLASLKVRARREGESKGHSDAIAVLQGMDLSPEQISEFKEKLAALSK